MVEEVGVNSKEWRFTSQKEVDSVVATLTRFKDALTLVKEQDRIVDFSLTENPLEILVARESAKRGEVDEKNALLQVIRDGVGHHRLTRAGRAIEKHHNTGAIRDLRSQSPQTWTHELYKRYLRVKPKSSGSVT